MGKLERAKLYELDPSCKTKIDEAGIDVAEHALGAPSAERQLHERAVCEAAAELFDKAGSGIRIRFLHVVRVVQ